jgi:hypothetical protein
MRDSVINCWDETHAGQIEPRDTRFDILSISMAIFEGHSKIIVDLLSSSHE